MCNLYGVIYVKTKIFISFSMKMRVQFLILCKVVVNSRLKHLFRYWLVGTEGKREKLSVRQPVSW
jgi:hypothetical protein